MADKPLVSIIVGSKSDAESIGGCRRILDDLGITHEAKVFSAHRTPSELVSYVEELPARGVQIIITGAGMSAALPGVVAAHSPLPVLGIPFVSGALQGVDALLAVAQMPPGVPVGCLGVGKPGAKNAAILAARILALHNASVRDRLQDYVANMRNAVLSAELPNDY